MKEPSPRTPPPPKISSAHRIEALRRSGDGEVLARLSINVVSTMVLDSDVLVFSTLRILMRILYIMSEESESERERAP